MKKLLFTGLFSVILLSSFTKKTEKINKETIVSDHEVFAGCGEEGNLEYSKARDKGLSHRDARAVRRVKVRECRGGTWTWLCVGLIDNCKDNKKL